MVDRASTSALIEESIAPSSLQGPIPTAPHNLQSYNVELLEEMAIDTPIGSSMGFYQSFTFNDIAPSQ